MPLAGLVRSHPEHVGRACRILHALSQPTHRDDSILTTCADSAEPQIVASDSNGALTLWTLTRERGLAQLASWMAHDLEAWISAFNYHQPAVVYSGLSDASPNALMIVSNAGAHTIHDVDCVR